MKETSRIKSDRSSQLLNRVDELRAAVRIANPRDLARRIGGDYIDVGEAHGELSLSLWGQDAIVVFPELVAYDADGQTLNPVLQALTVYYFHTSDGTVPVERYIAFSELPDGRFYAQAFQSYTGEELRRAFGEDRQRFEQVAAHLGGVRYPLGDAAYSFQLFPKVSLLAVFWGGDEDFPSAYQILFDEAAPHHLPTDACAIAGSLLTRKLIATLHGSSGVK
jgi:hypothetical protein